MDTQERQHPENASYPPPRRALNRAARDAVGILVGGLIGWGISHYYYVESGKDLEKEAGELRHMSTIMLRGMEQAGWVKLSRDATGRITGMVIELRGTGAAEATGAGSLEAPSK